MNRKLFQRARNSAPKLSAWLFAVLLAAAGYAFWADHQAQEAYDHCSGILVRLGRVDEISRSCPPDPATIQAKRVDAAVSAVRADQK